MTNNALYFPPPRDWQVFQDFITSLARLKFDPRTVQAYGRSGQRQNGVDVFAKDYSGLSIGLQAKETKTKLSSSVLIQECDSARNFSPQLEWFILCTTERTDAKLQDKVNEIEASGKYSFKPQIWFWDDLNLLINNFGSLISELYDDYGRNFDRTVKAQHLSVLRLAFNRPAFTDNFLHERSYSDFQDALVDTKQLMRTGFLFDRVTRNVIFQTIPTDMLPESDHKKQILRLERALQSLYNKFLENRNRMMSDHNFDQSMAGVFNIERGKILQRLNKLLEDNNLEPISALY